MRPGGFTLLELLVAMAIFAVLGLGAGQMLQTIVRANERVSVASDSATRLNLAFSIMQRDFAQFVNRQVRDEYGELLAPMILNEGKYLVEFTRGGWSNPAGRSRSRLQRVAYSIDYEENTLTRHFWEVLDRVEDSVPVSQLLLEGVSDFRVIEYKDVSASSTGADLEPETGNGLDEEAFQVPPGVEVVVALNGIGEVTRLFQLVDGHESGKPSTSGGGAD